MAILADLRTELRSCVAAGDWDGVVRLVAPLAPAPAESLDEHRRERAHPVDHAEQVDTEHPPPLLERDGPAQPSPAHAGVVAHHVDGAVFGQRRVAQPLDLRRVGHVGRHAERGCARGREAIVDPEITRRGVIDRLATREYDRVLFIHEIAEGCARDVTLELQLEASVIAEAA